jgi:hypothetical protein
MSANSNHNGDIATWVKKVIDSCETPQQINSARRLLSLYRYKLDREKVELYARLDHIKPLQNAIDEKHWEFLETLTKLK